MDTFELLWYSSALYCAKEPILFNYYQNQEIYRFLWIRSFHHPMVFSLKKHRNKVILNIKKLDRIPQFCTEYEIIESMGDENVTRDTIVHKANRQANLVLNQTIHLSVKEWNQFEKLLNKSSFWRAPIKKEDIGTDGSEWIIEAHLKHQYWFANRWSPQGEFKTAGEYLIHLSGLLEKEEVY